MKNIRTSNSDTNQPAAKFANFAEKAKSYWTSERLLKITSGHKYEVLPTNAPELLRSLGLLNSDASMSADSVKKFIQINHLFNLFKGPLLDLNSRHRLVRILDAGCGSSFLTFLLAWAYKSLWDQKAQLIGVDSNNALIQKNIKIAEGQGLKDLVKFACSSLSDIKWDTLLRDLELGEDAEDKRKSRPHAVVALHACDVATDEAIALGIRENSDFIAVAPCCQGELARSWKVLADGGVVSPLSPAFKNPHLRRELAAHFTDLLRVLILRSHGYEVTTTEFTMSHATPKNTLIMAIRRGKYLREAITEYQDLVAMLGGAEITLSRLVPLPVC